MRLSGWSMDWFLGTPMFTFYFPLPFLLIAVLYKVFDYNISFKIVSILGVLLLPIAIYTFGKLYRFKFPYPEFFAVGSIAFLFMKSFETYGGNLLSTLNGEFAFSISFALFIIFLGTLYRGIEREKFDWLFIINSLLLACIVLSHIITTISLLFIIPSLLLIKRNWKALRYIIAVLIIGFLISSFWTIPFISYLKWTPPLNWINLRDIKDLIPLEIIPALFFGAIGLFFSILKKDKRTITIIWSIFVIGTIIISYNGGRLWNARLLPFLYLFLYLLAFYGLTNLIASATLFLNKFKIKRIVVKITVLVLIFLITLIIGEASIVNNPIPFGWSRWSYSGFESRDQWYQYNKIMVYLNKLPAGRIMYEFDRVVIEKFGTSRAFELVPYWTNKAIMGGLFAESSMTAPFHFINQAELSSLEDKTILRYIFTTQPPTSDFPKAVKHLKYMNTRYILANTPELIGYLKNSDGIKFMEKIGSYSIFEFEGSYNYIEIMDNLPVRYETKNWIEDITKWYLNVENLARSVILDRGEKEIKMFKSIFKEDLSNVTTAPAAGKGIVSYEKIENDKITFETTGIGQPHLIKVSYFPNWKAIGAYGPFLVSPSFMMVIPRQSTVALVYTRAIPDYLGIVLTILGLAILSLILILYLINLFKNKKSFSKSLNGKR